MGRDKIVYQINGETNNSGNDPSRGWVRGRRGAGKHVDHTQSLFQKQVQMRLTC
jgi:hypothetical protein